MKRIFTSILSAALLLTACQMSDLSTPSSEEGFLYATIEEVAATKTYMDINNNIRWSEGDQIVGFMKSSLGLKYQILPSSVGKTYASFENVSDSNGNINAGIEWDHNVVYYPYSDVVEAQKLGSNYSLSVSLPAEQTYAEGSFGNGSMAMVAVNETNNITFKNILGGMKLQLKGSQKVTSIQLVGKNFEKLSGAATVTAYTDETKPAITMAQSASASVTLDCGSGVQLNESAATEFVIALPPVLFSNGFTVIVTDSESQTYTVETDKANTVLRSSLLVMPEVSLNDLAEEVQTMHKRVLLYYVAGYNSLSAYFKADVEELKRGELPMGNDDVLLVYSHFATSGYNVPTSPTLIRLTKRQDGSLNEQIVATFPAATISSSSECVEEVLALVKEMFPSQSYGMIFSSHATGYLPVGYYQNPENLSGVAELSSRIRTGFTPAPYVEPEYDPSLPMTKSLGQDQVGVLGEYLSYEMNINDFADAIPMYLDYLLFDACLMGGIEVAYELKDMVGTVGFSQTEILVDGFCYENIPTHLLGNGDYDLVSVCSDYFDQYNSMTGVYRSATISLIDCARLDALAELCKRFFDNYSSELSTVDPAGVQRYFRVNKHWFYDLESILVNAGISEDDLIELHEVLDNCVIYKAHTPMFMNDFDIHTFSGFSMYLPCNGSPTLDAFYKKLDWNKDTGLVR